VEERPVGPLELRRVEANHELLAEREGIDSRLEENLRAVWRCEALGQSAVVEVGRDARPRVELRWKLLRRGAGAREEKRVRVDGRSEIPVSPPSPVSLLERQLGEREQRRTAALAAHDLVVEHPQGAFRVVLVLLRQVPAVENVLAEEALLLRVERASRQLGRDGAGWYPLDVDRRPAGDRHQRKHSNREPDARAHASFRNTRPGSAPVCTPSRITTRPLTMVAA